MPRGAFGCTIVGIECIPVTPLRTRFLSRLRTVAFGFLSHQLSQPSLCLCRRSSQLKPFVDPGCRLDSRSAAHLVWLILRRVTSMGPRRGDLREL